MNDKITIYYYTAWDGFAWQGCDETTAKSLQRSMEATKTLPNSSAEHPPFGGAVPCKVGPDVGVAVYRYHTREKGDLSGRDSLYIALAFVPLSVGCVDFAKILELPQLAKTKPGALEPEEISAGKLLLPDEGEDVPKDWLDKELDRKYHVLTGRKGLAVLSRLFFSEQAQLGFLNAVFSSERGIDEIVSEQAYMVNPTVQEVAKASEELQAIKRDLHGVLDDAHPAKVAMKDALDALDALAKKQSGYRGLKEYYDLKNSELRGDEELLAEIEEYSKSLQSALSDSNIESLRDECVSKGVNESVQEELQRNDVDDILGDCELQARKVLNIHVLKKDDPYLRAIKLSMDVLSISQYLSGVRRGIGCIQEMRAQVDSANAQLASANQKYAASYNEIQTLRKEKEEARRAFEEEKTKLEARLKVFTKEMDKLKEELNKLERKLKAKGSSKDEPEKRDLKGVTTSAPLPQPTIMPSSRNPRGPLIKRIMDRISSLFLPGLIVIVVIAFLVLALLVFKFVVHSPKGPPSEKERETIDSSYDSNNQPPSSPKDSPRPNDPEHPSPAPGEGTVSKDKRDVEKTEPSGMSIPSLSIRKGKEEAKAPTSEKESSKGAEKPKEAEKPKASEKNSGETPTIDKQSVPTNRNKGSKEGNK